MLHDYRRRCIMWESIKGIHNESIPFAACSEFWYGTQVIIPDKFNYLKKSYLNTNGAKINLSRSMVLGNV
ncbi:hypothetical protein TNCT_489431 [Trichonephila clavata]|uniref:Uncharacterized protein n=1 Tax=Trichonephila clavata TaxID=2740835 RepID=A0A8X6L2G5_TRICU|nr:hypothetical protein TNCT_489431 [Trichonephila clavata]